jgi:hypothetical protein
MTQPHLDWSSDVNLPVSGRTPAARHASATGAQFASRGRSERSLRYRQLLMTVGPLSDHEAAKLIGCMHTSINSLRDSCGDRVVPSGQFEVCTWTRNGEEYKTERVRWSWVEQSGEAADTVKEITR